VCKVIVDTPGFNDPHKAHAVLLNETKSFIERLEKYVRRARMAATSPNLPALRKMKPFGCQFALLYIMGCHMRISSTDIDIAFDLKTIFGSNWVDRCAIAFTHADLLGRGGLDAYLATVSNAEVPDVEHLIQAPKIGRFAVACADPSSAAPLLNACVAGAGSLPKPRGKAARRLRQAAARTEMLNASPATSSSWCTVM
jgi:hypothetical protein